MPKPLVVLADPDIDSLKPLEHRFLRELGDACEVEAITDVDYLDRFLEMPHDIEAFLVAEGWHDRRFEAQNISCTFLLVEEQPQASNAGKSIYSICKYDNQKSIFNTVTGICPVLRSGRSSDRRCQVILFFSPVGGSGCTIAALGVAAALQTHRYRVLYVDAEYVQSFTCYLAVEPNPPVRMASEMLRYSDDLLENMKPYIFNEGFDYLAPVRDGLAASGVPFDFFASFIRAARVSGRYDFVIVDTDSVFNREKSLLLGEADQIIAVGEQDHPAVFKMQKFINLLDTASKDRFRFVCNKFESLPIEGTEARYSDSFDWDGYIRLIEGDAASSAASMGMVDDVRQLAQALE